MLAGIVTFLFLVVVVSATQAQLSTENAVLRRLASEIAGGQANHFQEAEHRHHHKHRRHQHHHQHQLSEFSLSSAGVHAAGDLRDGLLAKLPRVAFNAGTNEVQRLTITGAPTKGVITFSFLGTSGVWTFDADNAKFAVEVQTKLAAVASVGANNVVAAPVAGQTAVDITFQGALASVPIGADNFLLSVGDGMVTLDNAATVALAVTTPGVLGTYTLAQVPNFKTNLVDGRLNLADATITYDFKGDLSIPLARFYVYDAYYLDVILGAVATQYAGYAANTEATKQLKTYMKTRSDSISSYLTDYVVGGSKPLLNDLSNIGAQTSNKNAIALDLKTNQVSGTSGEWLEGRLQSATVKAVGQRIGSLLDDEAVPALNILNWAKALSTSSDTMAKTIGATAAAAVKSTSVISYTNCAPLNNFHLDITTVPTTGACSGLSAGAQALLTRWLPLVHYATCSNLYDQFTVDLRTNSYKVFGLGAITEDRVSSALFGTGRTQQKIIDRYNDIATTIYTDYGASGLDAGVADNCLLQIVENVTVPREQAILAAAVGTLTDPNTDGVCVRAAA